jgi:DNA-binding transcriptional MerR regulator
MQESTRYTLDELAGDFGLTTRSARHYAEKVLPPGYRAGRGRRARYDQAAWNCFAFIRRARADGLTLAQITGLLRRLEAPRVDRVARGLETLEIMPVAADEPPELYSSPCMAGEFSEARVDAPRPAAPPERWQVLYADADLQIAHRGQATAEQRAQVRMAAAWIRRLFEHGA